jgi:hypothetical protein
VSLAEPRTYHVHLETWDEQEKVSTYAVTARSASAARYAVWIEIADAFAGWEFGDFLKKMRPRVRRGPSRHGYDYIREHYAVHVRPGDRIHVRFPGELVPAIVCEPRHGRVCYVEVLIDGRRHPSLVHPCEVVTASPGVEP